MSNVEDAFDTIEGLRLECANLRTELEAARDFRVTPDGVSEKESPQDFQAWVMEAIDDLADARYDLSRLMMVVRKARLDTDRVALLQRIAVLEGLYAQRGQEMSEMHNTLQSERSKDPIFKSMSRQIEKLQADLEAESQRAKDLEGKAKKSGRSASYNIIKNELDGLRKSQAAKLEKMRIHEKRQGSERALCYWITRLVAEEKQGELGALATHALDLLNTHDSDAILAFAKDVRAIVDQQARSVA